MDGLRRRQLPHPKPRVRSLRQMAVLLLAAQVRATQLRATQLRATQLRATLLRAVRHQLLQDSAAQPSFFPILGTIDTPADPRSTPPTLAVTASSTSIPISSMTTRPVSIFRRFSASPGSARSMARPDTGGRQARGTKMAKISIMAPMGLRLYQQACPLPFLSGARVGRSVLLARE